MLPLAVEGSGASLGLVLVLSFLVASVAAFVFWIWSLVDCLRYSETQYAAAGQNKLLWVLLIVLLGVLGSLVYLLVARPPLKGAAGR